MTLEYDEIGRRDTTGTCSPLSATRSTTSLHCISTVKRKGRETGMRTGRSAPSLGNSQTEVLRSGPGRSSRSFWQPTRGSLLSGRSS
jgi:hypothetical protein